MTKIESKVIDCWAMVAWAQDEPSAQVVESIFQAADDGRVALFMSVLTGDPEIQQAGLAPVDWIGGPTLIKIRNVALLPREQRI